MIPVRILRVMALVLFAVFSACTRQDKNSLEDRLQDHTWQLQRVVRNDVEQQLEACQSDNIQVFSASVGYLEEGLTKCDPLVLQRQGFTYTVSEDETTVYLNLDNVGATDYTNVTCGNGVLAYSRLLGNDQYRFVYVRR